MEFILELSEADFLGTRLTFSCPATNSNGGEQHFPPLSERARPGSSTRNVFQG